MEDRHLGLDNDVAMVDELSAIATTSCVSLLSDTSSENVSVSGLEEVSPQPQPVSFAKRARSKLGP